MLDPDYLRENPDEVKEAMERRGSDADIDGILERDERWRELKQKGDDLRHERNQTSQRIAELKQEGKDDEAEEAIQRSQELKEEIEEVEEEAERLKEERDEMLLRVPNVPHDSVPVGEDEDDNVEVRRWGWDDRRNHGFEIEPHDVLAEEKGLIDFERASRISGSGFYFMRGKGAKLHHGLVEFMRDLHDDDYEEVYPPVLVDTDAMKGTGQYPKFIEEGDAYGVKDEDLWLIPTAEVPVTNMYKGEYLSADELPIYHQAVSACFRREAGKHGTETRGIARVHQFDKVELVKFAEPDESYDEHETLLGDAERVLQELGLPYRVLELCTGDLSFAAAKCYDLEVWAPAHERWLEVSSVSNFEDFQARRAELKYRPEPHLDLEHIHTLNGSGLAVPRVIIAILEYYQTEDGTVEVPEALQEYVGFDEI
ncbi:MAG: serine--tRNA ligase [Halobacteria archaeon]|nr:serine--tRNA ligase [Halobacteria archaeon]